MENQQGRIVRTTPGLEAACAKIRADGILSLDTEFVWRNTYRPQLGIVQLGNRSECWALDCQTGMRTEALKDLMEESSVVKVLHDARQDMALLRRYTGCRPTHVFDTQLAAAFAGFRSQVGLQKLLSDLLDVNLPKTETQTDWMHRPLTDAQVEYALDDVRCLPELREALIARADQLGTRVWLEEELRKFDGEAVRRDLDAGEYWKRVKLRNVQVEGRGWAVLRSVATLREELARKWNLPRAWVADDTSLALMAERGNVTHFSHRLRGGQADAARSLYSTAIATALRLPPEDWPDDPRPRYIQEVRDAADEALDWLEERAVAIHVDAATIATHATVLAYVDDVSDGANPLAHGWRYEVAGREMAERFGVD